MRQDKAESLILAIQQGALDARPFEGFVPLLSQALDATYTNLIFRRTGGAPTEEVEISAGEAPDWIVGRYKSEFSRLDPIPYFQMEPGRVYLYEELSGCDLVDDPFHRDFLVPAGFVHFLIFRVIEPAGCNIWITVTRNAQGMPFGVDERALCARLATHLAPSLACHSALIRAHAEKAEYQRAAEMLSFGVIALDGCEQVIRIDRTAERSLERCRDISVSHGRLRARIDDARLQRSLRAALDTQRVQSQHVAGGTGFDLLIVPVERPLWADGDATRLLVYISGGKRDFRDRSRHFAAAFDLSPTQARLATLLVEGRSLTDAAKEIGITEQTARTYSKEIYSRTGTSRQGDLIQRLLKSVITLA